MERVSSVDQYSAAYAESGPGANTFSDTNSQLYSNQADRAHYRSHSRSRSPVRHEYRSRSNDNSVSRQRDHSYERPSSPRRRRGDRSRSTSRDRPRRSHHTDQRRRRFSRSPRRHDTHDQREHKKKELHGTRDAPDESNVLGVFGLSMYTREADLEDVFSQYGTLERVTVVYDHRLQRSRGFGFVYFADIEDAKRAREALNGTTIDQREVRVDYSVTHRPHTPTPGEYMGERSQRSNRFRDRRYGDDRRSRRRSRTRSPPTSYKRRSYRSRSRS